MAEEKIRILVAKDPCETCKLKPCPRKCMFSILYEHAPGMPRQEAIEKMSKAIYAVQQTPGTLAEGALAVKQAEAALNALLECK